MATFPTGRILPVAVNAPGAAMSPRPLLPPGVATVDPGAVKVSDSTQCVEFQAYIVTLPANVE